MAFELHKITTTPHSAMKKNTNISIHIPNYLIWNLGTRWLRLFEINFFQFSPLFPRFCVRFNFHFEYFRFSRNISAYSEIFITINAEFSTNYGMIEKNINLQQHATNFTAVEFILTSIINYKVGMSKKKRKYHCFVLPH